MKYVLIDFETRSFCDLNTAGAWVYAADPTTEVLCLGYSIDGGEPQIVTSAGMHVGCPVDLKLALEDREYRVVAHNVGFEKAIWTRIMEPRYGWPVIAETQWLDTMAECAYRGVPLALKRAGAFLNLPQQKGDAPPRFFKPDKNGEYPAYDPAELEKYCLQDIRTEVQLFNRIGRLPPDEEAVWRYDQKINGRGVQIDLNFVRAAWEVCERAAAPMLQEFKDLTGGLTPNQTAKIRGWMLENGVDLPNLQKETLADLLGESESDEDYPSLADCSEERAAPTVLPPHVRRALEIRQQLGSSSIKKLARMLHCTDGDGRARGLLQYHGASTGRWSGRLLQPQNFPRGTVNIDGKAPDPDAVVNAILTGDPEFVRTVIGAEPIAVVSSALRHAIIAAPGHTLVVGDFSTVEARIVLALAGQKDKVEFLRNGGPIYEAMAEKIYGHPVNKKDHPEQRQTGKSAVLGLGFQMGWAKFQDRFAPNLDEETCRRIVDIYRNEFAPEVPKLWRGLEYAALETVKTGRPHEFAGCIYQLEDGFMTCRLPNGRKLWYYDPQLTKKAMPWDATDIRLAWSYLAFKGGKICRVDAYGGLLTENVVQALARDFLVAACARAERERIPVVLTVHDELVGEVPLGSNRADPALLQRVMEQQPLWGEPLGVPIAAECWAGTRYRK